MKEAVITADLHGKTAHQAKVTVDALLRRAGTGTYRIRLIHGSHSGTALRDMIRREYAGHPKVKRIELGLNQGVTDLILREY